MRFYSTSWIEVDLSQSTNTKTHHKTQIRDNSSHWEIKNDFYASKPWKCISSMTSFLANLHTTFLNKLNAIKSKSCWYKFTLSNEWKYFPLRHFILCVVHVVIIWNVAIKLLINYANHTSERYVNEDKSKDDDLIQLGTTSYTQFMSNWEIKTCITLSTTQKHQLVTNVWHEMTWRDWIKIEEKWRKREKNCIELHLCRWITIIIIESENHFGISKKNITQSFRFLNINRPANNVLFASWKFASLVWLACKFNSQFISDQDCT